MLRESLFDTIAAIATSSGEAGIGIVRLSGKDALEVAGKIFIAKDRKPVISFKSYTLHYGWVIDPASGNQQGVEEVLLSVMRGPRSYTREDVVEINCHGGIVAIRKVMDLVLENGCRLAEPGEFTKRAFLNGRIDLAQAEAVLDIIRAKSDSALKVGIEQLRGGLSQEVNKLSRCLLDILAVLEANIDFSEEEIGVADMQVVKEKISGINRKLKAILDASKYGKLLREGIQAVICGRPNVGKSSLLNALLRQERSIVTAIPGTTRDTIEEIIDIRGIPVRIVDTAGILEPRDLIEKKAIERSKRYIDMADLVIILFDSSKKLGKEDRVLISKLKNKTVLAVVNKIDMKEKIERSYLLKHFKSLVDISAKKRKNIGQLEDAIAGTVYSGKVSQQSSVLLSNFRHIQIIRRAQKLIAEALDSLDNGLSVEFVAQDIKDALVCLDEVLGKKFSESLLDKIFSDFCIGK